MDSGYFERVGKFLIATILAFLIITTVASMAASGKADYCYIDVVSRTDISVYRLYSHRPWGIDKKIFASSSIDEVKQKSVLVECELR